MVAHPAPDVLILPVTCTPDAAGDPRWRAGGTPGFTSRVRLAPAVDGSQRPSVPNTCQSFPGAERAAARISSSVALASRSVSSAGERRAVPVHEPLTRSGRLHVKAGKKRHYAGSHGHGAVLAAGRLAAWPGGTGGCRWCGF